MKLFAPLAALSLTFSALPATAQTPAENPQPAAAAVEQLRHAIGTWDATTEYIDETGAVSQTLTGQYRFGWVVPDRVVSGVSVIPDLQQASAILFFVNPRSSQIEMDSVGADGHLWRMIGPDTGETRVTPATQMADGTSLTLRFTRYDVTPNAFRSRMELSTDGGTTWRLGNRQSFTRVAAE